jgi:hypothetical protein
MNAALDDLQSGKPVHIAEMRHVIATLTPTAPLSLRDRWVLFQVLVDLTHALNDQLWREE